MRIEAIEIDPGRSFGSCPNLANGHEFRINKVGLHEDWSATPRHASAAAITSREISIRIEAIKQVWSQGAGNSIELAKVVWEARRRLFHGQWAQLWAVGALPFSKRKGEMLAAIGNRLGWLDVQTSARLPRGWNILYQLAQLDRATFDQLVREGGIHSKLTLREAKELVAKFKGRHVKPPSEKGGLKQKLRQFRIYVRRTLSEWKPAERELVKTELTALIQWIDAAGDPALAEPASHQKNLVTPSRLRLSHPAS